MSFPAKARWIPKYLSESQKGNMCKLDRYSFSEANATVLKTERALKS